MNIITLLAIIIITFIFTGAVGKMAMHLFTHRRMSYSIVLCVLVLSSAVCYVTIGVCITMIAYAISYWLGIAVGILTIIGVSGGPMRSVLKDAHHSLNIARSRRHI